jgi:hypothetical protein
VRDEGLGSSMTVKRNWYGFRIMPGLPFMRCTNSDAIVKTIHDHAFFC